MAPVLATLLGNADPAIRLAAAEELWELAGQKPDAFSVAEPALRQALDDADPAIAMNAAGALATMNVPAEQLAPSRRRVLADRRVSGYVAFLAARGLVSVDPAPPLLPDLVDYYLDAVEAEARGGSDDNVQIADQALSALCSSGDAGLVAPMLAALDASPPATCAVRERRDREDAWCRWCRFVRGDQQRPAACHRPPPG